MHLPRKKTRNYVVSAVYFINRLLPLSKQAKLKFYLNLEWIFDRLSNELSWNYYGEQKHPFRIYAMKFLLPLINKEDTVLDLGCKKGVMADMMAEKAREVVGIDFDESSIAYAKQHFKRGNLSFHHAEAYEYLKKNNLNFDVLVLSHILEHLDEPEVFLLKFKVFFKYIYVEVPEFEKIYLNQYRKDLKIPLLYTDADHVSEFNRDELTQLLDKTGIQVIHSEYRFGVQRCWCKVL